MKIRFNLFHKELLEAKPRLHPQDVMKSLGIKYKDCEPQPIADQWMFFGCENIPDPLPKFLEIIKEKQ